MLSQSGYTIFNNRRPHLCSYQQHKQVFTATNSTCVPHVVLWWLVLFVCLSWLFQRLAQFTPKVKDSVEKFHAIAKFFINVAMWHLYCFSINKHNFSNVRGNFSRHASTQCKDGVYEDSGVTRPGPTRAWARVSYLLAVAVWILQIAITSRDKVVPDQTPVLVRWLYSREKGQRNTYWN